jgi:hypothetical protein
MDEPRTGAVNGPLSAALARAWQAIQARPPEVADVVITVGGHTAYPQAGRCAHFVAGRWAAQQPGGGELFVSGAAIRRPPVEVFASLAHEAAHSIAQLRGITDTRRQGRYHNRHFRAVATDLGLAAQRDDPFGYRLTTLTPATAQTYTAELAGLAGAITAYRSGQGLGSGRDSKPKTTNRDDEP